MLEKALTFISGFVTGALYASIKYEKNPNDLIGYAKEDISNTAEAISDGVKDAYNAVESKIIAIKNKGNEAAQPEATVVDTTATVQ